MPDAVADLAPCGRRRRMLLVLDNFEQILDAAPLLVQLFTELPETTFLVTSRARAADARRTGLRRAAARASRSRARRSLDTALRLPRRRLFRDRARAANPLFELTEANVAAVVRHLRGAGGRSPRDRAGRRSHARADARRCCWTGSTSGLPLLVASSRDLPDRQRTIEATIEWSVGLLDAQARELLMRLGVFAGDFSLDAVEAVGADATGTGDTLTSLSELIDNSLVRSLDSRARPMFGMLATVREFALAELERAPGRARFAGSMPTSTSGSPKTSAPLLQGRTQLAALDPAGVGARESAGRGALPARDGRGRHPLESRVGSVPVLVDPRAHARRAPVDGCDPRHGNRGLRPHACDRPRLLVVGEPLAGARRGRTRPLRGERPPVPLGRRPRSARRSRWARWRWPTSAAIPPILDRAEESRRACARPRRRAGAVRRVAGEGGDRPGAHGAARHSWRGPALRRGARPGGAIGDMFAATLAIQNRAWAGIALGEPRPEMFERYLRLATASRQCRRRGVRVRGPDRDRRPRTATPSAPACSRAPPRPCVSSPARRASSRRSRPISRSSRRSSQSAAAPIFEAGRARGSAMTVQEATEFALGGDLAHDDDMPGESFG